MNREIKFRSFDDGKIIYEKNIQHLTMEDNMILRLAKFWSNVRNDSIIMQFTGVKDANGVDIYEGDIMQHANPFDIPFLVNWSDDNAGFVFNYGSTTYNINDKSFTVIGNIYQNPELLFDIG